MKYNQIIYLTPINSSSAGRQKQEDFLSAIRSSDISSCISFSPKTLLSLRKYIKIILSNSSREQVIVIYNYSWLLLVFAYIARILKRKVIVQLEDLPSFSSFGWLSGFASFILGSSLIFSNIVSPLSRDACARFVRCKFRYLFFPPLFDKSKILSILTSKSECVKFRKFVSDFTNDSSFIVNSKSIPVISFGPSWKFDSELLAMKEVIHRLLILNPRCVFIVTVPPTYIHSGRVIEFQNYCSINFPTSVIVRSFSRSEYVMAISKSSAFISIRDFSYSLRTFPSKIILPLSLAIPVFSLEDSMINSISIFSNCVCVRSSVADLCDSIISVVKSSSIDFVKDYALDETFEPLSFGMSFSHYLNSF